MPPVLKPGAVSAVSEQPPSPPRVVTQPPPALPRTAPAPVPSPQPDAAPQVNTSPSAPVNPLSGAAYNPAYQPRGMQIIRAYESYPSQVYGIDATRDAEPFRGVVLHHDPTGNIRYYGQVDQARGGQFGYHFAIGPDGRVYQTAPMNMRTNHIGNRDFAGRNPNSPFMNGNTIGVTYLGGETPTPEATAALEQLMASLRSSYGNIPVTTHPAVSKAGHRGENEGADWLKALAKLGYKTM